MRATLALLAPHLSRTRRLRRSRRTRLTLTLTVAIGAALLIVGSASAGGFATVGLSSTPDGTEAGQPWHVELTVSSTVRPRSTACYRRLSSATRRATGGSSTRSPPVRRVSTARPSVFPTAGTWNYAVDDGFVAEVLHDFPPAEIGAPAAMTAPAAAATTAPTAGGRPWGTAIVAGLATGLLVALISVLTMRRRREPTAEPLSPTA